MFLTISMFWQWQNKQHFFFSRQILNPQATFLKLHPNIVAADFVLLFRCWFGMSYWQLKSIHGDGVMRTRISAQPDTDHHLRAEDYKEQLGQFCSDIARFVREYFSLQNEWLLADSLYYFATFSSQGVQNLISAHTVSEILSCTVGPAQDLWLSLLLWRAAGSLHTHLHFTPSFCFCKQDATKPKQPSIVMQGPPKKIATCVYTPKYLDGQLTS